jgi:hypothetical protein
MPRKKKEVPVVPPLGDPAKEEVIKLINQLRDEIKLPPLPGPGSTLRQKNIGSYRPDVFVRSPALAYVPTNRSDFAPPEYDLSEIARALDTESLVVQSVTKHHNLCIKEGWFLNGKDPDTVQYIEKRLLEMEMATDTTFDSLVREVAYNTVLYHNNFIVFKRDAELSSGAPIKKYGQRLDPIAGMFCCDPTTMRIQRNRWGEVKRYYQFIEGGQYNSTLDKYFQPEDVVHIHYNRKTGMAWGTPYLVSVLDDIRLFRSIEETVNMICHKSAFPIYHYKVGTEKMPCVDYENGESEITRVEDQIRQKPPEGIFVTPERHEIAAVDADAPVRNLVPYLEHFKMRVLAGLNLSAIDVGEGDSANRATANQMSKSLQYRCKDYQKVVSNSFMKIFDDLLVEGGFKITSESRVYLTFPEIDVEMRQLVENHAMVLYNGEAIDEDELRRALGKEPFTEEQQAKRHIGMVTLPTLEMQRQAAESIAEQKAASSAKLAASKNKPSNQYGTKAAAGSRQNDYIGSVVGLVFDDFADALKDGIPEDRGPIAGCIAEELIARLSGSEAAILEQYKQALVDNMTCFYSLSPESLPYILPDCRVRIEEVIYGILETHTDKDVPITNDEEDMGNLDLMKAEMKLLMVESENRIFRALIDSRQSTPLPTPSTGMTFNVDNMEMPAPNTPVSIYAEGLDLKNPLIENHNHNHIQLPLQDQPPIHFTPTIVVEPTPIENHNHNLIENNIPKQPAPIVEVAPATVIVEPIFNIQPSEVKLLPAPVVSKTITIEKTGEGAFRAEVEGHN